MAQCILVLEKDTTFLQELKAGFSRYDVTLEIVEDVDASVEKAKAQPPAVMLVSADAMDAPGEAFRVFKRFKSDDDLSKIPFVIMGSATHDDTFESHKRLKRRADEYIRLPISFDDLVARLTLLVPLAQNEGGAGDSLDVDADIDAFADNAFEDLLQEQISRSEAPPPLAVGGETDRASEELEQLKQQLDSLTARAESAEKRAEAAERKSVAVPRATSMAPPGGSISSRDYLEMREQLNRKDKEILGLRDEVTTRDRQILDASDRSLELEKVQAGLHDDLALTQRQLDDAQGKIKAYETDREAVAKRLEDLKGRLSRAEDKSKKLENELDTARTQHASEIAELKTSHEGKVSELEAASAAEIARLRATHAVQVSDLEAKSEQALEAERNARAGEVAELREAQKRAEQEQGAESERKLAELKAAGEAELARALAEALADKNRALADVSAEHAADVERKLSAAGAEKDAALAGLRNELESQKAQALKDVEDKHGKELAILGRKLSESESKVTIQEERIQDLEHAKQELDTGLRAKISGLETELTSRVEERDRAQNELSAARASIASHERTESQQAARVADLEGALVSAERQVQRQATKLASDGEILERVRKALGIGIGLLEQQRENVPEEA